MICLHSRHWNRLSCNYSFFVSAECCGAAFLHCFPPLNLKWESWVTNVGANYSSFYRRFNGRLANICFFSLQMLDVEANGMGKKLKLIVNTSTDCGD